MAVFGGRRRGIRDLGGLGLPAFFAPDVVFVVAGEDADFAWITAASDRLAEVERGMRRNLLRSLSLDAFAAALEKG